MSLVRFFIFEHLLCTSLGQGLRIPERELWLRGDRLLKQC